MTNISLFLSFLWHLLSLLWLFIYFFINPQNWENKFIIYQLTNKKFALKKRFNTYANFVIFQNLLIRYQQHTNLQSICTWFFESAFYEIDFWTWFFVFYKLDFTVCVACKNQVPNRQKIKLKNWVKKSISWNRDSKKSRTDR